MLAVFSGADFVYTAGRVLIQITPTVDQKRFVEHRIQIEKPVALAAFSPTCYGSQGGVHHFSDPTVRLMVPVESCIPLSIPSPLRINSCSRLSRPRSTMDRSDSRYAIGHPSFRWVGLPLRFSCRHAVSPTDFSLAHRNIPGLPSSCVPLFTHATPLNPAGPLESRLFRFRCAGFCHVKNIAIRNKSPLSGLTGLKGVRLPCGLCDTLCTLRVVRSSEVQTPTYPQHSIRVVG